MIPNDLEISSKNKFWKQNMQNSDLIMQFPYSFLGPQPGQGPENLAYSLGVYIYEGPADCYSRQGDRPLKGPSKNLIEFNNLIN